MAAPNRFFACETRVVSGLGCISQLSDELSRYKISNPALVVDSGIANAGLLEKWFDPKITSRAAKILAPMNPDLDAVRKGIDVAKASKCDGVVIVGGGSSICLGKAIAICLVNPGDILEYEGNEKMQNVWRRNLSNQMRPLILARCQFPQSVYQRLLAPAPKYPESLSFTNMAGPRKSSFEALARNRVSLYSMGMCCSLVQRSQCSTQPWMQ